MIILGPSQAEMVLEHNDESKERFWMTDLSMIVNRSNDPDGGVAIYTEDEALDELETLLKDGYRIVHTGDRWNEMAQEYGYGPYAVKETDEEVVDQDLALD